MPALLASKWLHDQTGTEVVCTTDAEVNELLEVINLAAVKVVADPWAGLGSIERCLKTKRKGIVVFSSDRSPIYWWDDKTDALSQAVVQAIDYRKVDVVICSPWYAVLDLAIPLLMGSNAKAFFLHVPSHYLTNMPQPRRQFMAGLLDQGRVEAHMCREIGPLGRRCTWLLIFRSAYWRTVMMKRYLNRPMQDGEPVGLPLAYYI